MKLPFKFGLEKRLIQYIAVATALASDLDLDIDQMDAVSAFLQGDLNEELYMWQPQGYVESNKVCRLKRSLYGLRQSSRMWNNKLDNCLKNIGLQQSKFDRCVYFKRTHENIIIVAAWVDDLLIFSSNKEIKDHVKSQLAKTFQMKDLGEAKHILGFKIDRDRKNKKILISQKSYMEQILKRFNMENCNSVSSPMVEKLSKDQEPKNEGEIREMENIPYQEAVGSLLFVSQVSRPDLAFAVSQISRFNNNPGPAHWAAVKRIFRYIKGTIEWELEFDGNKSSELVGFCDADWASDPDERRSVTGYIFTKNNGPISWGSKRQPTIALSTTEAEYMSIEHV